MISREWLLSKGFSENCDGFSILLPPQESGCVAPPAIVELKICSCYRGKQHIGWSVGLLQALPDSKRPDDHVVLTSLPIELSRERFVELCRVLGVSL